jgi:tetratricopeptide (TPR) repeat protein
VSHEAQRRPARPGSHRIRLCARQGRPVSGSDRRAHLLENPNTPRALNYRGYATRKLGRTYEGIGYYLKSVALDPAYPQVREYLGEAYIIEGKYELAKEQLSTIEKLCGKDREYYNDLADALTDAHAL